jgi:hypothetical protein
LQATVPAAGCAELPATAAAGDGNGLSVSIGSGAAASGGSAAALPAPAAGPCPDWAAGPGVAAAAGPGAAATAVAAALLLAAAWPAAGGCLWPAEPSAPGLYRHIRSFTRQGCSLPITFADAAAARTAAASCSIRTPGDDVKKHRHSLLMTCWTQSTSTLRLIAQSPC